MLEPVSMLDGTNVNDSLLVDIALSGAVPGVIVVVGVIVAPM